MGGTESDSVCQVFSTLPGHSNHLVLCVWTITLPKTVVPTHRPTPTQALRPSQASLHGGGIVPLLTLTGHREAKMQGELE